MSRYAPSRPYIHKKSELKTIDENIDYENDNLHYPDNVAEFMDDKVDRTSFGNRSGNLGFRD